ncbi:glycerol-3-phosphate cytidylyltransferase [Nocardioides currus]|uniref:Glycerol-3-phosphate cytidylyltransferase n=1 Tax=Nocardioides currus TaxID=2133958 RepID=A0A2R7YUH8_9ACTN|nr:glycerol-3-phosphate cytidylyltransferase [Nocardioides currus]
MPGDHQGEVVGYTAGVFDLLHVGHVRLLEQARAQCDRLVVGVTTDELCEQRKHKTPIIGYADRAAMLRSLRVVDEVVPQTAMDRLAAWDELRFDVTFVGDDWKGTESWKEYDARFAQLGVRVVYFSYTGGVSSTLLRARLAPDALAAASLVADASSQLVAA